TVSAVAWGSADDLSSAVEATLDATGAVGAAATVTGQYPDASRGHACVPSSPAHSTATGRGHGHEPVCVPGMRVDNKFGSVGKGLVRLRIPAGVPGSGDAPPAKTSKPAATFGDDPPAPLSPDVIGPSSFTCQAAPRSGNGPEAMSEVPFIS